MKGSQRYQEVMAGLMTGLGMVPPDGHPDGTYSLNFSNGAALYFRQAKDEFIDVLAEAGKLNDHTAQAVLADLLALNRLSDRTPPILVGLDHKTGVITVNARIDLARCGKNVLTNLVWDVLGHLSAAQSLLTGGSASRAAGAGHQHIGRQLLLKAAMEGNVKEPDAHSAQFIPNPALIR